MGTAKLITFFDLLSAGYTVAQLASAVEAHGATGWDRFGRFGAFPPKSEGSRQALDALADYFGHSASWWHTQSDIAWSEESGVIGSPLDDLGDQLQVGIHRFGWPESQMPSIDRSEKYPPAPILKAKLAQARDGTLLNILGAILLYIEVRHKDGTTLRMPSEARLIDKLCEDNVGVTGISVSNLQKWFAAAKKSTRGERTKS
jgi:hypothetical protein